MTREFSRHAFIRGALGTVAAGALSSACRSTAPQTQAPPTSQSASTVSSPQRWTDLDDVIEGHVIVPSNPDYAAAKGIFNARFDDSAPAAVVTVRSAADVSRAVEFAADKAVKVSVRSGGHSYVGASAANATMVIDLRQLAGETTYDRQHFATIPAATQLDSVQTTLASHGRSVPSGSCPTVGIGGLTLGGGFGADARRCGLTCDALVSAAVVLPSGESITASADDHADLFWALRGGGAVPGVVTSFVFRTFPVADRDVATLVFPQAAAARAVFGWHEWLQTADRAIWGMVNITADAGSQRCTIVLATPAGDGESRAADLSSAIGVQPISTTTRTLDRMEFVHYFEGGSQATQPRSFVAGSDIIGDMTPAAADSIVAATSAWPGDAGAATAVIESLSGAVADVGPGDTAFPWRRQAACVQWYTEPTAAADIETATAWLADAHAAVHGHSSGGYVNYLETSQPASRYFGDNTDRLAAIRQKYDPTGLMYSGM